MRPSSSPPITLRRPPRSWCRLRGERRRRRHRQLHRPHGLEELRRVSRPPAAQDLVRREVAADVFPLADGDQPGAQRSRPPGRLGSPWYRMKRPSSHRPPRSAASSWSKVSASSRAAFTERTRRSAFDVAWCRQRGSERVFGRGRYANAVAVESPADRASTLECLELRGVGHVDGARLPNAAPWLRFAGARPGW